MSIVNLLCLLLVLTFVLLKSMKRRNQMRSEINPLHKPLLTTVQAARLLLFDKCYHTILVTQSPIFMKSSLIISDESTATY